MANYIRQDAINNAVLFKLFEIAQVSGQMISYENLSKEFKYHVGAKRISLSYEHLSDENKITYYNESGNASINRIGYKFVEEQLIQSDSFLTIYSEHGDDWLINQTLQRGGIPASDRVVSRQDNLPQIEEIVTEIDGLIHELKADNEVGSALGDDREILISEASASKELLRSERFRVARLAQLIVPGLKFLADKFGGGAIGEVAKRLVSLILALL